MSLDKKKCSVCRRKETTGWSVVFKETMERVDGLCFECFEYLRARNPETYNPHAKSYGDYVGDARASSR